MQCQSSVVLTPLIVVSCFTVPTLPHEGHLGGNPGLMEFSGIDLLHRFVWAGRRYDTADSQIGKHYASFNLYSAGLGGISV